MKMMPYTFANMRSFLILTLALSALLFAQQKSKEETMSTSEKAPEAPVPEKMAKVTDEQWKEMLTPEQYRILRKAGTERPNGDVYKQFKEQGAGTYYCAGCNAELFTSKTKFDSHCGWPSFYDPSDAKNVKQIPDLDGLRVEVRCKVCDGHLGHVFSGERFNTPTDQRYCINGAVLKFVPAGKVLTDEKTTEKEAAEKKDRK